MADVFISYSRKDTAFVRQLSGALEEQGVEVWVDWQDIPPTSEWWTEITEGIDGAHTFLFVISPNSVASPILSGPKSRSAADSSLKQPVDSHGADPVGSENLVNASISACAASRW